jgi:hypothetical protein
MEKGCQKLKRLSYTAKFKREVIRCAEKGNRKSAAMLDDLKHSQICLKLSFITHRSKSGLKTTIIDTLHLYMFE